MDMIDRIEQAGIVPVVVIENAQDAVPTAKALLAGGITFMEITFRTECAIDAIRNVARSVPEMVVGAGTIWNQKQAEQAVDAGASFIVSPGLDEETVIWCQEKNIPVIPGCVTPTEIIRAMHLGLSVVKFFPANIYGGIKAIRALGGVFRNICFLPTGGVDAENMIEYVQEKSVLAIGGSWVCPAKDITGHQFEKITSVSRDAVEKIHANKAAQ